jgi:hypothetical protein
MTGEAPGATTRKAPHAAPRTTTHLLTLALATLTALLALASPAAAHPLDIGYLRITTDGPHITVGFDLHVNAAARLVGAPPERMDADAVQRAAAAIADATVRRAPIITPAGACRWTTATAQLTDRTASLTADADCPATSTSLTWTFPFIAEARVSPTFQVLVKAHLAGEDHVAIVDRTRPTLSLAAHASIGFTRFVWTGIEHIGAAPSEWRGDHGWKLPDGIDHILFLCALMLAGGSLLRILGIVSGFTLGHSITLALSALHILRPPSSLIEPLIALSIALVAAEAMLGKFDGHRWRLAAFFGLVHGFGFASALNQMSLSTPDMVQALFGYNLGVELGQITIVLCVAPLILYLQRHRQYHWLVRTLAALILLAGLYWFVQRL